MITTEEEEDTVVRWAFAEIMGYLKINHDPYWFKFNPNHMKIHKIMYNVFEAADIPVTRSWYRYGCFIHSRQLAGFEDFSTLKNRYLRSAYPPERLQSAVDKMGFDTSFVTRKLHEIVDTMPQRMDAYLESLYQNAPRSVGNIYIAKMGFHNALRDSTKIDFRNSQMFQNWFVRVRRALTVFHMSAFSHNQFNDLACIVMDFTADVEEALLKIDELIMQRKRVLTKWIKLIHEFSNHFDGDVWLPFALEISAQTVKGFRETQVRNQQLLKKKEKILESINELKLQHAILAENSLLMSCDDYRKRLSRVPRDTAVVEALSELERIYEKSSESD